MQHQLAGTAHAGEQLGRHRRVAVGPAHAVVRLERMTAVHEFVRVRLDTGLPARLRQDDTPQRHAERAVIPYQTQFLRHRGP